MDTESTAKPQKKLEYRVPPGGVFQTYSNNVQLATTSFDVRVLFGQIGDVSEDTVAVEQRAVVTMSWVEAKILADFLQANIKAYEELNGPIKLGKNLEVIVIPDTFQMRPK